MLALLALALTAPPGPADNAALYYLTAVNYLPTASDPDPLDLPLDRRPDENFRLAVAAGDRAMTLLHCGAAVGPCVWPANTAFSVQGIGTLVPEAQQARQLGRHGLARATLRFHDGDPAGAIADVLAVVRLGRHLTELDCLLGYLIGAALEQRAVELVGRFAWAGKPADWQRFLVAWDALPPGRSLGDALRAEGRVNAAWVRHCGPPTPAELQQLGKGGPIRFLTLRSLVGLDTFEVGVAKTAAALEREYRRGAERVALPAAAFPAAEHWTAVRLRYNLDLDDPITNILLNLLSPAFGKLRAAGDRQAASQAMLRAAVQALAAGKPPTAGHDAAGTAFAVERIDTGYRLRSEAAQPHGRVVELDIHTRPPAP